MSIDEVARDVLKAGTNVSYAASGGTRASTASTDKITSAKIRATLATLRSQNVPNFNGFYTAYIHPNVSYDLRSETGGAVWRDPHTYSQPGEIWAGELGAYEGFRFIETPRAPVFPGAGSGGSAVALSVTSGSNIATYTAANANLYDGSDAEIGSVVSGTSIPAGTIVGSVSINTTTLVVTLTLVKASDGSASNATATTTTSAGASYTAGGANVYGTLFVGRQSLAKAWSMVDGNTEQPHVVPGPITDFLRRFVPWGWYWLGGYSIYRQASVQRLETGSSLTYADPAIDQ